MPKIRPEFWANIQNKMREMDITGKAKSLSDYLGQNIKEAVEDIVPAPVKLADGGQGTFGNTPVAAPKRELKLDYPDKESFPAGYKDYLIESADQYGIDPNILASLIASESGGAGYQPDLTGTSGEVGIAQIIPKFYYESAGFSSPEEYSVALQDPAFAIEQAAVILKDLLTQYDNNYFDALASYNGGSTGYQTTGAGYDYARDTLNRVGMVDQYTPSYNMVQ